MTMTMSFHCSPRNYCNLVPTVDLSAHSMVLLGGPLDQGLFNFARNTVNGLARRAKEHQDEVF